MTDKQTIIQCDDSQLNFLISELKSLDKHIENRVEYMRRQYNFSKAEALEYVVTDNPILWAKVYLDWEARDYQFPIIEEGKKSRNLVLRLGRRLGKCLTGDTLIPDCKTGKYVPIEELYKKQEAHIYSLNTESSKVHPNYTNIILDNGIKPVYKVTTHSGREITCTDNHPFWTVNGFVEARKLQRGTAVGIAKGKFPENAQEWDFEFKPWITAYLIDNAKKVNNKTIEVETGSLKPEHKAEILEALSEMGQKNGFFVEIGRKKDVFKLKCSEKKPFRAFLDQFWAILGEIDKKRVPEEVFSLNKKDLTKFLKSLLIETGELYAFHEAYWDLDVQRKLRFVHPSEDLLKDIQSLLLRFGINSCLVSKAKSLDITPYLIIPTRYEFSKIMKTFDGLNTPKHLVERHIKEYPNTKNYLPLTVNNVIKRELKAKGIRVSKLETHLKINLSRPLTYKQLKKVYHFLDSEKIGSFLLGDIIWDHVESVEFIGNQQTYDFTVENTHNFVANDFITHNTDSMCVLILWYAYTQHNRGPNNQYDILVLGPTVDQVDLIFDRLHQLLKQSPLLTPLVTRDIQHRLELDVNNITSKIAGFTAGSNNKSSGSNNTRGQRADLMILDEADYIGSAQITNIINIRNEAPERIHLIAASTPSGAHEEYYRWCVNASKRYSPTEYDMKHNLFSGYVITEVPVGEGNGWTEIYAPSNVNKELLKLNPLTGQTYIEDLKNDLPQMRFTQEVMAQFGEEAMGVYQKRFISYAIQEGKRINHTYITDWDRQDREEYLRATQGRCIRILGVDWDKFGAGTNMVCMEFDPFFKDEDGATVPKFKMMFRVEIPPAENTYQNAVAKIVELNKIYRFDWIACDAGHGESQIEQLHKIGMDDPSSGLADKVVRWNFAEKINVIDPYTRKATKTHFKPFMVNNSVKLFERGKIILNPDDRKMVEQLEEYHVLRIAEDGHPIFSKENEHALDAMNLALFMYENKYGALLKRVFSIKTAFISNLDKRGDKEIPSRAIGDPDDDNPEPTATFFKVHKDEGIINLLAAADRSGRRRAKMFERGTF